MIVIAAKINDMDFGEDGDEIIFDTKEDADEDIDDVSRCLRIIIILSKYYFFHMDSPGIHSVVM